MDQERYQQLIEKRDQSGLSDEEADELGRLMAEMEGQPYGGPDTPQQEAEDVHGGDEGGDETAPTPIEARERDRAAEEEKRGDIPPGR